MSKIKLTGSNSGYVEISSAADAGNLTLALPTSGTELLSNGNNVYTGITTFSNDVKFEGASYDVLWDKSDNQLEFGDNAKLSFGTSSDLQLYHDSNNSIIKNNTNILLLLTDYLQVKSADNVEHLIGADKDGSVRLNYNGNVKVETTNTGAVVTGICTATSFSGSGEGLTRTTQLSHRNKVINGAMQVAQRGTTFTFSSGSTLSAYTLDRFKFHLFPFGGTSATATVTQSGTAPDGFTNSLKVDVTATDTSLVGNNYSQLNFQLERQDIRDFAYGTSSAKTITLSFYVRSNKTGNYNVNMLAYGTSTRLASFTYAISSPNTWERKTITVAGDTAGNIVGGTDSGLQISFGLAYGGNYTTGSNQNSFGSFVAANLGVGQDVNLYDSTSNNWYITGVQLEVGSVATPFEHRKFGDEMNACRRYFYMLSSGEITAPLYGIAYADSNAHVIVNFPVEMRAIPTLYKVESSGSYAHIRYSSTVDYFDTLALNIASSKNHMELMASGSMSNGGHSGIIRIHSTSNRLGFDAEL